MGEQALTAAHDNPDGDAPFREHEARAVAEDEGRRAAERKAQRPVGKRCRRRSTDER
ncbi:hypothetical protein [Streptomyces sp. DH12]|uniref:hypothetical protein n=1 Tax=Streptomyces sp. DH12 TaxID=2857010 RepID=UPI001E3102B7|nr:hypothetical protein [Streptomyces sp. DH12]